MFFKANTLRDDQNFFKPVSQLKTSVIVWYLTNPLPPCHVVGHLTASQVKSIWGITEEELEEMYFDDTGKLFSHDTDRVLRSTITFQFVVWEYSILTQVKSCR